MTVFLETNTASYVNQSRLKKTILAQKTGHYLSVRKTRKERAVLLKLARILVEDIELSVRTAFAFEVRSSPYIPKSLALVIAKDVEQVSGPFLKSTPVLADTDFALLIPYLEDQAKSAIAARKTLGSKTIFSLINHGTSQSATFLARNRHHKFSGVHMHKIFEKFGHIPSVVEALVYRDDLPLFIVERLIDKVAGRSKDILITRYNLDEKIALKSFQSVKYKTLLAKIKSASKDQIRGYAIDLHAHGKLSNQLILQAVKNNLEPFVTFSLALKTHMTTGSVFMILSQGDQLEMLDLLSKAGMDLAQDNFTIGEIKKLYP